MIVSLCGSLGEVRRAIQKSSTARQSTAAILLDEADNFKIKAYLTDRSSCQLIDKYEAVESQRDELTSRFLHLLKNLNIKLSGYEEWWALPLSTKSLYASDVANQILNYMAFEGYVFPLLQRKKFECLIVYSSNESVLSQVSCFVKERNILCVRNRSYWNGFDNFIRGVFPWKLFISFLKSVWLKNLSHQYKRADLCNFQFKQNIAIWSLVSLGAFNGNTFRDVYFGSLHEYFRQKNISTLIVASIFSPYRKILRKIKNSSDPIFPSHLFISYWELVRILFRGIRTYFTFSRKIRSLINNDMPAELVCAGIQQECNSFWFWGSLVNRCISANITSKVRVDRWIYPFENRSWERHMLFGVRESSPNTKNIAYIHSTISPKHISYWVEKDEARNYPVPDKILTNGFVNGEILKNIFHVPSVPVSQACGLRYEHLLQNKSFKSKPKNISNLLFVLTASEKEYVNGIHFLNQLLGHSNGRFKITVRAHHILDISDVLKWIEPHGDIQIDNSHSLKEQLMSNDVFLYSGSSACVDALACGVPSVYIRLPNFFDTDPLHGFNEFKWSCENPKHFDEIIRSLTQLSDDEYYSRQDKGIRYLEEMVMPVTESRLGSFLT